MQDRSTKSMIAALDVYYNEHTATAAAVIFQSWADESPADLIVEQCTRFDSYQPGYFYKRELPCLLNVLKVTPYRISTVIIDGYVWLKAPVHAGLGAHLYSAMDKQIAVIGVAKTFLEQSEHVISITRGHSLRPLFISSAGMETRRAAECIRSMHGKYRIPALLKMADQLSRQKIL